MTTTDARAPRDYRRSLTAANFGDVLQWYALSAYAVFALFIARGMFDDRDPASALLATLAIFAAGFLMRPLDGIVFGRIADRVGRRQAMVWTLLMMGGGSLLIALTPSFNSVGVWASVLLLVARVVQSFDHGGESATSNSHVAEISSDTRRGPWGSTVYASILGEVVLAAMVGIALLVPLGVDVVTEWAWRSPFLLGNVLAPLVLVLRRRMHESEVFAAGQDDAIEATVAMPVCGARSGWPSPWSAVPSALLGSAGRPERAATSLHRLRDRDGGGPVPADEPGQRRTMDPLRGGRRRPGDRHLHRSPAVRAAGRTLSHPGAHARHQVGVLGLGGRFRRHRAVPERTPVQPRPGLGRQPARDGGCRRHRGGCLAHARDEWHLAARGRQERAARSSEPQPTDRSPA